MYATKPSVTVGSQASTAAHSVAELVDRRQRLAFGLGGFAGLLESVAPALLATEMVNEDSAQTPLADDVRPRPYGRVQAVEDRQHPAGRPAVVGEQERISSACIRGALLVGSSRG